MRRLSPSSSALPSSAAERMNVPSKKPPARPTVHSLTRATLSGSRAFPGPVGRFWAAVGDASSNCAASAPNNANWYPSRYVRMRHPLNRQPKGAEMLHSPVPRPEVAAIDVYYYQLEGGSNKCYSKL